MTLREAFLEGKVKRRCYRLLALRVDIASLLYRLLAAGLILMNTLSVRWLAVSAASFFCLPLRFSATLREAFLDGKVKRRCYRLLALRVGSRCALVVAARGVLRWQSKTQVLPLARAA